MNRLEPSDYSDVGQAKVFVAAYGGKVRHCKAIGDLIFDGTRWVDSELGARALAQELTDLQLAEVRKELKEARAELDRAVEIGDSERENAAREREARAKRYRAFVLDRRKTGRISATLTEARPALEVAISELDKDPFALNTPKGTVDLRTGIIKPNDAADYCTKQTAVPPSNAGMGEFMAFLEQLTCNDAALQEYLQLCCGMAALGGVYAEKLIIAFGDGGNGKSTFFNAVSRTLGDYAGNLSAEVLTMNCRKNKSPEIAELRGKRLVIAAELDEGSRLDTAVVKRLCSTDDIQAERKYHDPFSFRPSHSCVLYTNHLPKVGANDRGTWDRLCVLPFNARFRGELGEIMNYGEHLFEHCGGAILTWVIEGARKFIEAAYRIEQPECVVRAIAAYRAENDWVGAFIQDCCDKSDVYRQRAGDLFDAYRDYCTATGEIIRSAGEFKSALCSAGYAWRKTSTGAVYSGLRLKPVGVLN